MSHKKFKQCGILHLRRDKKEEPVLGLGPAELKPSGWQSKAMIVAHKTERLCLSGLCPEADICIYIYIGTGLMESDAMRCHGSTTLGEPFA